MVSVFTIFICLAVILIRTVVSIVFTRYFNTHLDEIRRLNQCLKAIDTAEARNIEENL